MEANDRTARCDAAVGWVEHAVRLEGGEREFRAEPVAREEPLEIRLAGLNIAVTMRTPGHDIDLVSGFVVTEGIVPSLAPVSSIAYCLNEGAAEVDNIINLNLHDPSLVDPARWRRSFYLSSSCGICGKASIQAVMMETSPVRVSWSVPVGRLYAMPEELLSRQVVFRETGGLHAAGVFHHDDGRPLAVREDIGRHNAVDKAIGAALRQEPDALEDLMLMVSGRASFEIVQKAARAGIPLVAAVSAPSSLAVELAQSVNITLVGFLREGRCNVYAHAERIVGDWP